MISFTIRMFMFLFNKLIIQSLINIIIILSQTSLTKPTPSPIIQNLIILFHIHNILHSIFKPQSNQLLLSPLNLFHQLLVILLLPQNLHFLPCRQSLRSLMYLFHVFIMQFALLLLQHIFMSLIFHVAFNSLLRSLQLGHHFLCTFFSNILVILFFFLH